MARRFRFRLETVLRLRHRARDAQRRVAAEKARAVVRVEERIAGLTHRLHRSLDGSRRSRQPGLVDVVSLRRHQLYGGWLKRKIGESDAELARRKDELDAERARLAEASKQLKVIEKLRERRWREYVAETAREERAACDEAALQMYSRCRTRHGCETPAC